MTQVYRLCTSAYRASPLENGLHSQLLIHVSSPSTTNNEGGGWVATGPIGWASGITFSSFVETDVANKRPVNRACVAKDSLWLLTGDTLFSTDYVTDWDSLVDGFNGNPWISRLTLNSVEAGRTGRNTGIYPIVYTSGTTKFRALILTHCAPGIGATTWRGVRYNLDTYTADYINADLSFTATAANGGIQAECFWNNKLYFIGATDGGIGVFDPLGMTLDRTTWSTSDIWGPHDFCPYKGKLYVTNRGERGGGGGSGIYVWEVTRPTPLLAVNLAGNGLGTSTSASEPFQGRSVLFTDRDYLFLGCNTELAGTNAYRFIRMSSPTGALTYDGINPTLFNADLTVRANFFTEQNSHPDLAGNGTANGQLMTVMIDRAGTTGTLRQQWHWTGPDSSIFLEESTLGNILHTLRETARSDVRNGGGERIWDPLYGGPRVDITNYAGVSGLIRVSYKVYNNTFDFHAGTPAAVQLKYDTNGHLPYKRGNLRNPSHGTLAENNTVMRIVSDSGVTYTVDWDYVSHGIPTASLPMINLLITTSGAV